MRRDTIQRLATHLGAGKINKLATQFGELLIKTHVAVRWTSMARGIPVMIARQEVVLVGGRVEKLPRRCRLQRLTPVLHLLAILGAENQRARRCDDLSGKTKKANRVKTVSTLALMKLCFRRAYGLKHSSVLHFMDDCALPLPLLYSSTPPTLSPSVPESAFTWKIW